jgi:hypothetical protein
MVGEKTMKVRLTFLEETLGTQPSDSNIYANFLDEKQKDAAQKNGGYNGKPITDEDFSNLKKEEMKNLPAAYTDGSNDEDFYRGVTVFPRLKNISTEEEVPAMYGYMLKGFFKNACSACREVEGSLSVNISAYKKKIDNLVHINRISPVIIDNDTKEYMKSHKGTLPLYQRPIRISGQKGERVALACSEYVPEGSYIDFEITTMNGEAMNWVIEWLDYGKYNGLGCWHNSGKGRFEWTDLEAGGKREIDPKCVTRKGKKKAADEE